MTKALVRTQIRLHQLVASRETGQGTLEYVGMIVIAALFVAGLVLAANGADLDGKLKKAILDITGAAPA